MFLLHEVIKIYENNRFYVNLENMSKLYFLKIETLNLDLQHLLKVRC